MTPAERERLERLADLLASAPFNLLSRRDRELVWERHVGESARVWESVRPAASERWLDLGTGGGLPGLVLAVLSPETQFTLVDARAKKIAAVSGFVRGLGLVNVESVVGRAEALAREDSMRGQFDVVISRALGKLPTVMELSRGFVRPGGRIVAVRGGRGTEEVKGIEAPLRHALGVTDVEAEIVSGTTRATWLVRMHAVGPPPLDIPRPDGIPAARPLDS